MQIVSSLFISFYSGHLGIKIKGALNLTIKQQLLSMYEAVYGSPCATVKVSEIFI